MGKSIFICMITFLSISCAVNKKEEQPKTWSSTMNQMGESFAEILPYIFDDKKSADPSNKQIIIKKIGKLKKAAGHISDKTAVKILGKDPIVLNSIRGLKDDLDRAESLYENGFSASGQNILKSTVGFCYQCHTRTNFGAENTLKIPDGIFTKISDPVQRSKAYVATRQFEKALAELKKSLMNTSAGNVNTFEHEKVLKTYLSIAIKSDRPVTNSINTLSEYVAKYQPPFYLAENIKSWVSSLKDWDRVKGKSASYINLSKKPSALYDADYVDTLIQAQFYHDQIMRGTTKLSDMYYQLGKIYEKYPEFNYWDISKTYYAACINESPKTSIAKTCYADLERAIHVDYSGSGGIFIPSSELLRLKIYKAKAGLN